MEMKEENKKVWIALRAEILKNFHDTNNPDVFENGYPLSEAVRIATSQLEADLSFGALRLTFEDMLLKSVDECQEILKANLKARFKRVIATNNIIA